jgi:hypothetical protein
MPDYFAAIFIKLIFYVYTVDSIVSILTIYYDFAHGLSRPNLIVLSCFLLDGIFLLPVTAPTRRDEINLVAPGRDLRSTKHRCPATRSTIYKAPFQSSARNGARLLLPAAAIVSSIHDPNEISDLPAHVLPARRTCSDRAVNV